MTLVNNETKVCKCCGRELPINQFATNIKSKDQRQSVCRECMSEKQKAAHANGRRGKAKANYAEPKAVNPELAKFKARDLIEELAARGYKGTLEYTFSATL